MTREYFKAITHEGLIDIATIIQEQNEIYKDIVKELSERTCESCKKQELQECDVFDIGYSVEANFSCNRWEAK